MSPVYYPFYSTAIFKVLNRLDFMGLQRQDVCLQSKLVTWYLIILLLLYSVCVFRAHRE